MTVLEVGGGIGAAGLKLLQAGAARAVNVELSPAYGPVASQLLREAGLVGRVETLVCDFVAEAGDTPATSWS